MCVIASLVPNTFIEYEGGQMKRAAIQFKLPIVFISFIFLVICSSNAYGSRADVEAFVTRFYQECLGRSPDSAGLNGWTNYLLNGTKTGADVAYGFVFSPEYLGANATDQEFLYVLYGAFFNRQPDTAGYNRWLNELSSETPKVGAKAARKNVLNGFLGAPEFKNLCTSYGITRGTVTYTPPIITFAPNVILYGSINFTENSLGYINLFGELTNIGNKTANFVKISFTFYDAISNVIATDFTYVHGSCRTLTLTDQETGTCLTPSEVGAFGQYTTVDYNSLSSYTYSIAFESYDSVRPDANLVVYGNITPQSNIFNWLELLGSVKNTGTTGLIFGQIYFAIKNHSGQIIATPFTYIDGQNVLISSINSYTDTALRPGSIGTFDVSTTVDFVNSASYYYKTSWDDSRISNNIAYSRSHRSNKLSEIVDLQFQSEEERQNYRNKQIEEQRIKMESLSN